MVEQTMYDTILNAWNRMNPSPNIRRFSAIVPNYSRIVEAVHRDHPEIFWVDIFSSYTVSSVSSRILLMNTFINDTLDFRFFYSPSEVNALQKEMAAWRNKVISQVPDNKPDTERLWLLFDYMARRVSYGERGFAQSHTIVGCFRQNNYIAVCQGIAKGMKYLCESCRIPCIIVDGELWDAAGNGGLHNWNIISIQNQFRHIDATSEISIAHQTGCARSDQVALTDQEAEREGYIWDRQEVPACIRT